MDGGLSQFRVEKLSDSNYHVWKEHIQSVLCLKDLDIYMEEDPPVVEGAPAVSYTHLTLPTIYSV